MNPVYRRYSLVAVSILAFISLCFGAGYYFGIYKERYLQARTRMNGRLVTLQYFDKNDIASLKNDHLRNIWADSVVVFRASPWMHYFDHGNIDVPDNILSLRRKGLQESWQAITGVPLGSDKEVDDLVKAYLGKNETFIPK